MATTVYETEKVKLMDGTEISIRPLKLSLLRPFMKKFEGVAAVSDDNEKSLAILLECVQIAMRQYHPEIAEDIVKLEDSLDLPTLYKIVEIASGAGANDSIVS